MLLRKGALNGDSDGSSPPPPFPESSGAAKQLTRVAKEEKNEKTVNELT